MSKAMAETMTSVPDARPSLKSGETRPRQLSPVRCSEEAAWEGRMDVELRRREAGTGDGQREAMCGARGTGGLRAVQATRFNRTGWRRRCRRGSPASSLPRSPRRDRR